MLNINFLGRELENPFLLASAPPAADADMLLRAFELGWAGAVTKTLILEPVRNVANRFAAVRLGGRVMSFENIELLSERAPAQWYQDIRRLKREFPHKLVISSIMGDAKSVDPWLELALGSQDAGADMVELNFSCPHGYPDKGQGSAIGQSAEYTALIVGRLKSEKRLTIPVVPKLTMAVAAIQHIGAAAAQAGADALSAINTVPCFMGFDLDTLAPRPSVGGYSTTGGLSGPAIKPIALRAILDLARSPGLPLMAGGGIFSGYDAAEFMLLGAPLVQICTAVMLEGYGIIGALRQELCEFMERHHFAAPADFIGKGLASVRRHDELDRNYRVTAELQAEACTRCGKCAVACRDGGYQAISLEGGRPQIDRGLCSGCSLCVQVCPAGALAMQP